MTTGPSYVVHVVDEKELTVDWFFGPGHLGTKAVQLVLVLIGWFFAVLPVVITASALVHRYQEGAGWWEHHEGFRIWDETVLFLTILTATFVVGFLALHLADRAQASKRAGATTYDRSRLARRLEIARDLYADKYGPEPLRLQQRTVRVAPHSDLETYELRGLYRSHGVG